jgi:hypothetical protein
MSSSKAQNPEARADVQVCIEIEGRRVVAA